MLDFTLFNIHSMVQRRSNFNQSKILFVERNFKDMLKTQGIRATKANIESAKQSVIAEIQKFYIVESVVRECNGDVTIKR